MTSAAPIQKSSRCTLCPLQGPCASEPSACIDVMLAGGQLLRPPVGEADFVYIVREGALKTCVDDESGAEWVLAFHIAGDVVRPDMTPSDNATTSWTLALGPASLCQVPLTRVLEAMAHSVSLRKRLAQGMRSELQRLQMLKLDNVAPEKLGAVQDPAASPDPEA